MTVSVAASGNQTADGLEDVLTTGTTAGTYVLAVNVTNMADGDVLELRIYGKANASDSETLIYFASFNNAQTEDLKLSLPTPAPVEYKATLKQTAGTNRTYQWGWWLLG